MKGLATLLVFVTCGLAMPLLFAPSVTVYLACFAPAFLLPAVLPRSAAVGAGLGLFAALAIAFYGPRLSSHAVEAEANRVSASDLTPTVPFHPATIEIRRPRSFAQWHETLVGEDLCDAACRALVLDDGVEWVRIVTSGPGPTPNEERVRLRRESAEGCAAPGGPAPDLCVVYVPDGPEAAALVLVLEEAPRDRRLAPETLLRRPTGVRQITAADAAGEVRLRATEIFQERVMSPTLLTIGFRGIDSAGIEPVYVHAHRGDATLATALRTLGFRLTALDAPPPAAPGPAHRREPTAESTRALVSVLDLPPELAFTAAQQRVVATWLDAARHIHTWDDAQMNLLRRTVLERRASQAWSLQDLVVTKPDVARALLGDVVARTEAEGVPHHAPWKHAWYGYGEVSGDVLSPVAPRIAALLDTRPELHPLLLPLAGKLGEDPSRWLLPLLEEPAEERLVGACRADERWSAQLVPPLTEALDVLDAERDRAKLERAGRALARHGAGDDAIARLRAKGPEGERLANSLRSRLRRATDAVTLCR